jgi:CheY-like chemotaxis protein
VRYRFIGFILHGSIFMDTHATPTRPRMQRILIVEDSEDLAVIISKGLEQLGLLPYHESDGAKAVERYLELLPKVVLLDINLPNRSGWEILDHLREIQPDPQRLRIGVITALGDPASRMLGRVKGVHSYLTKPFTQEQMQQMVRGLLEDAIPNDDTSSGGVTSIESNLSNAPPDQ